MKTVSALVYLALACTAARAAYTEPADDFDDCEPETASSVPAATPTSHAAHASSSGWSRHHRSRASALRSHTASAAAAKPTNGLAADFVGCFVDSGARVFAHQAFSAQNATVASCRAACGAAGYAYAGLEYSSECWCNNALPAQKAATSECAMKCAGDAAQFCGDNWRLSVYPAQGGAHASGSASKPVAAPSSVSVATSEAHPSAKSTVFITSYFTATPSTVAATHPPTTIVAAPTHTSVAPPVPTTHTSVAAPAPSTHTSSAAAPAPTSGANSGKRGLGFNDVSAATPFGKAASFAYNWYSSCGAGLPAGVEYVPMLWGADATHVNSWAADAQKGIDAGARHLLGFNEPDLGAQSNLSPQAAAAAWKAHMQPFAGKAKLVSPAITNGAPPAMGTGWLDSFLEACNDCTIDAIAIHIYDSASNVAYFQEYIAGIGKKYGKPVWVTEFGASGSTADQQTFLNTMVPWLDSLASVEKYAYFGDFEGTFVQNGKLLPLGQTYASA